MRRTRIGTLEDAILRTRGRANQRDLSTAERRTRENGRGDFGVRFRRDDDTMRGISERDGHAGNHSEHGNHHHAREEEWGKNGGGVVGMPRRRQRAFETKRIIGYVRRRRDVRRRETREAGTRFILVSSREVKGRSETVHGVRGCDVGNPKRESRRYGRRRRQTIRRVPEPRGVGV